MTPFWVVLVVCITFVQINTQCHSRISWVTLSGEAELSWAALTNGDNCTLSYFMLHILREVNNVEYIYRITTTKLIVDFLPPCETYWFRIVPVTSDDVEGFETTYPARIPPPLDANFTVASLKASQQDEYDDVLLEWHLEDHWVKCADIYRVIIYDEEADEPKDLYVYDNSVRLTDVAPCTTYRFGLAALYNAWIEGPVSYITYSTFPARQSPPILESINLETTSISLTWRLENYVKNKCAVTSVLTVSPYFNVSTPVVDQVNRPPVPVLLTHLQLNTMYLVNTIVINSAGPSVPIIVAVQTLET